MNQVMDVRKGTKAPTQILTFFLLLSAFPVFSDVIYLKNGRQIECDSAWEEGKEVRYSIGRGTVGIPRAMVSKIVKSETKPAPAPEPAAKTSPQTTASQKQDSVDSLDTASKTILARSFTDLGKEQLEKKDFSGALENFKKAYSLIKDRETIVNLAVTYFLVKDNWNAELLFHELLKLEPKNTIALNYLGEIAWRKENLDDAVEYWQKSVQIHKDPLINEKLERLKRERRASSTYENTESRHFIMRYDGGKADPFLVNEISDFLEQAYQKLSLRLDAFPTTPFVVILYPQEKFQAVTDAPLWSAGINDGKIKLPIRGVKSLSEEMKGVLVHELTHSFVNFKTAGNCPVWLQEGLAQQMEGKQISVEADQVLTLLASESKLPGIQQLNGSFVGAQADVAQVLYVQSLSFTAFLTERYPFHLVNSLLEELGKGNRLDDAFLGSYLVPLSRLENEWRQSLLNTE